MNRINLPQYPNLFDLDGSEIETIEDSCKKNGHLGSDEKLLDRIKLDNQILNSHGLSNKTIHDMHCNMWLKFNYEKDFDDVKTIEHNLDLPLYIKKIPNEFGNHWCCWSRLSKKMTLNGQELIVTCAVWGGAEECPIEKYFSDKYHGYSRGDRDWFVHNTTRDLYLWIPDLVPAQVGMFGFFQGLDSEYRLDPELYIKVFGLDLNPSIKRIQTKMVKKWVASSWGNCYDYNTSYLGDNTEIIKTEHYTATINSNKNKLHIVRCENSNEEININLFGYEFYMHPLEKYAGCILNDTVVIEHSA